MEPTNITSKSNVSTLTPGSANAEATARLNKRRVGYSWNEYFMNKNDGDVWVQNLSDMQVSLDIEVGPGLTQGKLLPPLPDPVNLSEEYGFEVLKKSARFRQALAKRRNGRPDLILLDAEQVDAYFAAKARMKNLVGLDGAPDIDAAMALAAQERIAATTRQVDGQDVSPSNQHNFAPPKSAQELISIDLAARGIITGNDGFQSVRAQANMPGMPGQQLMMTEVVDPKVLDLCLQVSPNLPDGQRMSAETFMAHLQTMTHRLNIDSWQHIEAHGTYRSVKRFARQKIAEMAQTDEGLPDNLTIGGQRLVGQAQQRGDLQAVQAGRVVPQGFGPQGPATLGQAGMQYQGPAGFVNAGMQGAGAHAESMSAAIVGPDGNPIG